jgi:hypothetical protein
VVFLDRYLLPSENSVSAKITIVDDNHGEQPVPNDVPPDWKKAIPYACMTIGETELTGNDVPPERPQPCAASIFQAARSTATSNVRQASETCGEDSAKKTCTATRAQIPPETGRANPGGSPHNRYGHKSPGSRQTWRSLTMARSIAMALTAIHPGEHLAEELEALNERG